MFRTISNTEDPLAHSEPREKAPARTHSTASKSTASTQHEPEDIERGSLQDDDSPHNNEKRPAELKRTASNALSRVASRVTTRSITDPGPPPDGGLKAWTQVAMGFIAIMTTWGWINSFGAFQTYYELNLDESPSSISWIGTVQNFLTFFLAACSGRLLDAGVFTITLYVGVAIQVLGIFMMSLSRTYWQLLITQGVMTGLGGGIFFTPALGLVATYFSSKRALALSFASTGNAVGGAIYPVIVRQLLPQIGFAWTTRVIGFFNLAMLGLVIAFMRPRLPPRKSGPLVDWSAFTELPYVCITLGMFFQVYSIYFVFYYVSPSLPSTSPIPPQF